MKSVNSFIEEQMLKALKPSWWLVLKSLVWMFKCIAFDGETVQKGGEILQNVVRNGFFRQFLGGFATIFAGIWVIIGAISGLLLCVLGVLASPFWAVIVILAARNGAKQKIKAAEDAVKRARATMQDDK